MNLMETVRNFRVPEGGVTIWSLGQNGFLFKSPEGCLVVVDPYLSNRCKAIGEQFGFNMDRMQPAPISAQDLVHCDAYVLTHSHPDHLDPETLMDSRAVGGKGPYVAPPETFQMLVRLGVPAEQITMVWPNNSFRIGDMTLRATFAIPMCEDDLTHVGYLINIASGPTVYLTGDTAYHPILTIAARPHQPEVLIAVINGAFRNMAPGEAALLARELGVRVAIPAHYDLFPDNSLPPELFRTNLKMEGIGDTYQPIPCGSHFTFVSAAGRVPCEQESVS